MSAGSPLGCPGGDGCKGVFFGYTKRCECSRGAGKTEACARYLLAMAQSRPRVKVVYVAMTRMRAKELLLPILLDLDARHNLGLQIDRTDLTVRLPNGSEIMLRGDRGGR